MVAVSIGNPHRAATCCARSRARVEEEAEGPTKLSAPLPALPAGVFRSMAQAAALVLDTSRAATHSSKSALR